MCEAVIAIVLAGVALFLTDGLGAWSIVYLEIAPKVAGQAAGRMSEARRQEAGARVVRLRGSKGPKSTAAGW